MPEIQPSDLIADVQLVRLQSFADERGRFMETFRTEWFPQRRWEIIQSNRSDSRAGTLRGLHFHYHQVDYWYVVNGRLRVGMVDLRPFSPTYLATQTIEMGRQNGDSSDLGLFIPIGVAHGFVALTDVTLTYIVDNYYNGGQDENGVLWKDPDINLNWGVTDPLISPRDAANPRLRDILTDLNRFSKA
jgi:dTDP-4-dehydrorhamnose 3,5-epimerase